MMLTSLNVLGPVADVLIGIKYKIGGTGHVMFSFSFAHVIMRAVVLVRVVANVAILLSTCDFVGCKLNYRINWLT